MKTKVEINGYEIEITEMEGRISVKAEFEGEVIEEFSIDTEEAQEGEESEGGEDIKSFDDFGGEEEDFAGEEAPEGLEDEIQDDEEDDDDDDDDDEENGSALESFQSFINKKK
jgi:hypothetical protein